MIWSRSFFPKPCAPVKKLICTLFMAARCSPKPGPGLLYVGARGTWYPNRGLEMARFDLQFRYPVGWTLLATGKRVEGSPSDLPPGEQFSHWVSDRPMPIAGFQSG